MDSRTEIAGTGTTPNDTLAAERQTNYWKEIVRVVHGVLIRMRDNKEIAGFKVRGEDADIPIGADFSVFLQAPYDGVRTDFGVTTSASAQHVRAKLHQGIRTLHFPVETKPDTIRNRILTLIAPPRES